MTEMESGPFVGEEDSIDNYDISKLVGEILNNCSKMCDNLLSVHGNHQNELCKFYRKCYKQRLCPPLPIDWLCCMIYSICNKIYSDKNSRPETMIPNAIYSHRKWDRQWLLYGLSKKNMKQIDIIVDSDYKVSKYIQCEYISTIGFYTDNMRYETERIFIMKHNIFLISLNNIISQINYNFVPILNEDGSSWIIVKVHTPNRVDDVYEFGIQFQLAVNEILCPTTQFGIRIGGLRNITSYNKHIQQMNTEQSYELDSAELSMRDTVYISPYYRFNMPILNYYTNTFDHNDPSLNPLMTNITNIIDNFIEYATKQILEV